MPFASDCNLRVYLPAAAVAAIGREEGNERKKDRVSARKKHLFFGFSLAKRLRGSGTTGKEDKEERWCRKQDDREACCFFSLKRDGSSGEEKEGNSGRKGGR